MATSPRRLFLDAGVVIAGCLLPWGSSKAVLVLATLREHYTVVLAEPTEREIRQAIARRARTGTAQDVDAVLQSFLGWLQRVRLEPWPRPTREEVDAHLPTVLPVLRHRNDLDGVVRAMQARPDWVISANDIRWSPALAARTNLRILTPRGFLSYLSLQAARVETE
jgi:hypothetical protein